MKSNKCLITTVVASWVNVLSRLL